MKDICFEEDDEYFLMKYIKNKQTKNVWLHDKKVREEKTIATATR